MVGRERRRRAVCEWVTAADGVTSSARRLTGCSRTRPRPWCRHAESQCRSADRSGAPPTTCMLRLVRGLALMTEPTSRRRYRSSEGSYTWRLLRYWLGVCRDRFGFDGDQRSTVHRVNAARATASIRVASALGTPAPPSAARISAAEYGPSVCTKTYPRPLGSCDSPTSVKRSASGSPLVPMTWRTT